MNADTKQHLKVTVFTDYVCPFCYVGDARLDKLRDSYDLDVDWCFFEIHPDNPPEGKPVAELGYPPERWRQMMANLEAMAREDGLPLAPRTFTTNSHKAMLLAEAAKSLGEEVFQCLHKSLFATYFAEAQNIGAPELLRATAAQCGIPEELVESAWRDEDYEQRLRNHYWRGAQIGIGGVPAFVFGRHLVSGAVPVDTLRLAAKYASAEQAEGVSES